MTRSPSDPAAVDVRLALVRRCFALADEAAARGDHPFGALLAREQGAEGRNAVVTSGDVTRHAELALVSAATPALPAAGRGELVLYTSTEPCPMCAGAVYWSGVGAVVYGCSAAALAEAAGGELALSCREVLAGGRRPVAVVGPVLEAEGRAQHRAFWRPDGPPR